MFRNRLFAIKSGLTWLMTALLWLGGVPWLPIESAWAISTSTLPSLNSTTTSQLISSYGKLPISFEANLGQTASQVDFLTRGSGYALFLTPDRAVLSVSRLKQNPAEKSLAKNHKLESKKPFFPKQPEERVQSVVSIKLIGANGTAKPEGLAELEGKSNYFIGNDPSKWHTDIPNFGKVIYRNVYPGIDLVYYGNQQQLEYDFVAAAGVDPNVIQLQYEGAEQVALNDAGELVLKTAAGDVIEKAPVVYQEVNGKRQPIAGAYRLLENNQVAFKLGNYDVNRPLVIDPVLIYSTRIGGSSGSSAGYGITVDRDGNAYIIGQTGSIDFPTQNPLQGANADTTPNFGDVFVSKLNASGNALVYSTYLGGNEPDIGRSIAVDSIGNANLTGETYSNNFPLVNPLQPSFGGASNPFVSKLNSTGNGLIYSSYLGRGSNRGNKKERAPVAVRMEVHLSIQQPWTRKKTYP